jgi:hypothetical protein
MSKSVLVRAAHTYWQSFAGVLGVTWAASGLNLSQVTDLSSAKRFGLAALTAVLAAALAAARTSVKPVLLGVLSVLSRNKNKNVGWAAGEAEKVLAALLADGTVPVAAPAPPAPVQ